MTTKMNFGDLAIGVATLMAAAALLLAVWPSAPAEAAKRCPTATSNITKLRNISCYRARRVIKIVTARSGLYASCRGDVARAGNWVARGIPPLYSHRGILAVYRNGNKSFLVSGGGAC